MNRSHALTSGRGTTWRPRGQSEVLPSLSHSSAAGLVLLGAEYGEVLGGGNVPGELRCAATGLRLGGCNMQHQPNSAYCYYHSKVQAGTISTFQETGSDGGWRDVAPQEFYPVWPLPEHGYIMLTEQAA